MRTSAVVTNLSILVIGLGLGFFGRSQLEGERASAVRARPSLQPAGRRANPEAESGPQLSYPEITSIAQIMRLPTDFAQSEATYVVAGRSGIAELERLIEEAERIENRNDRRAALGILFSRYGDLDPEGALAHLEELDLDIERDMMFRVVSSWAKVDLDAAVGYARQRAGPGDKQVAANAVLRAYEGDPNLTDRILSDLGGRFVPGPQTIAAQASRDPMEALDDALDIADPQLRMQAVFAVADTWGRADPRAAFQYADRIADRSVRASFLSFVSARWVEQDPGTLVEFINGELSGQERPQIAAASMSRLAQRDPQAALHFAQQFRDSSTRSQAVQAVVGVWAERDARAAANVLAGFENPDLRRRLLPTVAGSYARQDPHAALQWAERLDGGEDAWRSVLGVFATQFPQQALNTALSVQSEQRRLEAVNTVIGSLARTEPEAAVGLLGQLTSTAMRTEAMNQISVGWVRLDPTAAIEWMLTLSDQQKDVVAGNMASFVAINDPGLAASYVDRLSGPARERWALAVADGFGRTDPDRALEWVGRFQGDPIYDAVASNAVAWLGAQRPLDAVRLAGQITQSRVRSSAYQGIVSRWAGSDPAEAARWVVGQAADEQYASMVSAIARQWVERDAAAAEGWVLGLPGGAGRDQGLLALASRHAEDANRALAFIGSMGSESARVEATSQQIEFRLSRGDRVGASAFLAAAAISDESRIALQRRIDGRMND